MENQSKIIVRIWGGLGNQLFQYACGYSLAKRYNKKVIFDTSFYDNKQKKFLGKRQYKLKHLNISCQDEINESLDDKIKLLKNKYINKIIRVFRNFNILLGDTYYKKETKRRFELIKVNEKKDLYLDGYWQSDKYFKEFQEELIQEFMPKYTLDSSVVDLINIIESSESVALHVRRGDYITASKFNKRTVIVDIDYYKKAIEYIKKNIDNPRLFVFSDDKEWVKENLDLDIPYNLVEVRTETADIDEIICMSKCNHNIIAASTFSWWGAYLNTNKNAIKIAPNIYFNNEDIIPEDWIRI